MNSLAFIAAIAMSQVPDQTAHPIKMQLKLPIGTVIKSTLKMTFSDPKEEFEMITIDRFESKVIGFGPDEVSIEHKIYPIYLKMDGLERNTPNAEPAVVTDIRNRAGCLRKYEGTVVDEQANLMIARFWTVPLPSKYPNIGSDWIFSDQREMPYEFSGKVRQELDDRIILDIKHKGLNDDQLLMTGTATLKSSTGWPLRIDLKGNGCLVPGGEGERIQLHFEWETKEVIIPKS